MLRTVVGLTDSWKHTNVASKCKLYVYRQVKEGYVSALRIYRLALVVSCGTDTSNFRFLKLTQSGVLMQKSKRGLTCSDPLQVV